MIPKVAQVDCLECGHHMADCNCYAGVSAKTSQPLKRRVFNKERR